MIYICPVCGKPLERADSAYKCENRHSFDIARSGYVNLLLSKHIGKTVHGDNKLMVRARREFLEKGYYSPLRDALCEEVKARFSGDILLDAGCGEGYYTTAVAGTLNDKNIYGCDISKIAVELAAKRDPSVNYFAGSVFHLPVADASCDMLVTMFAPYCGTEFSRVLRSGGKMLIAIPSTEHLWEMKEILYDNPYKNEVKPYELEGFTFLGSRHLKYKTTLQGADDIMSLFAMTPYYYRTGAEQSERLKVLDELEITADFELLAYSRPQ
ncbi:MAG: methyltransferase domain-containing protein [Ruminococcus sp.]|nr:methyltransferase domain-containing protein [Ruminococcus sp.]